MVVMEEVTYSSLSTVLALTRSKWKSRWRTRSRWRSRWRTSWARDATMTTMRMATSGALHPAAMVRCPTILLTPRVVSIRVTMVTRDLSREAMEAVENKMVQDNTVTSAETETAGTTLQATVTIARANVWLESARRCMTTGHPAWSSPGQIHRDKDPTQMWWSSNWLPTDKIVTTFQWSNLAEKLFSSNSGFIFHCIFFLFSEWTNELQFYAKQGALKSKLNLVHHLLDEIFYNLLGYF